MKQVDREVRQAAKINSSYSAFFLVAAISISFFLSDWTIAPHLQSWVTIIGFSFLVYFTSDFIRQLYSPGQSIILYALTFVIFPFIFSLTVPGGIWFWKTAIIVWLGASIAAGILELLYESIFKLFAPAKFIKSLIALDNALDKRMVLLHDKHLSFYNLRGVIVYLVVLNAYYGLAALMFYT